VPFTVIAEPAAIDELTEIWIHAPDRKAVTDASNLIDANLRTNPLGHGIESPPNRILYVPPLGVLYSVNLEDRLVIIQKYYDLA
jgi:hypothetical protein